MLLDQGILEARPRDHGASQSDGVRFGAYMDARSRIAARSARRCGKTVWASRSKDFSSQRALDWCPIDSRSSTVDFDFIIDHRELAMHPRNEIGLSTTLSILVQFEVTEHVRVIPPRASGSKQKLVVCDSVFENQSSRVTRPSSGLL